MMTKSKTTKRSLVMSVLSMLMCVAMLIGSTFAWFSDSVSTGINTITAGNLDVDIVDASKHETLVGQSIFREEKFLWEPGEMQVSKEFQIANKGTLAFWYFLTLNTKAEEGQSANLLDVVKMKVVKASDFKLLDKIGGEEEVSLQDRQDAWDDLTEEKEVSVDTLSPAGKEAGPEEGVTEPLVVVLYWEPYKSAAIDPEENIDNKYNVEEGKLEATFSVDVYATQTPEEMDSFGVDYDKNAKAGRLVTKAVVDGFASLNGIFDKDEDISGITVSPMIENECTFTFAEDSEGIMNAFNATKDAIAEAIIKEHENISSVAITDIDDEELRNEVSVTESSSKEDLAAQLQNALLQALVSAGGSPAEFVGKEISVKVVVTTTGGVEINYQLNFDLTKVKTIQ